MENLFRDIQARIKTAVPEIKWIDIDENQLEAYGENAPVDYPCVLVGFPNADYSEIGRGQQMAMVRVRLKVAFRMYERLNTVVPELYQASAMAHFAILRKLMHAVHLLSTSTGHYTPLVRQSWTKEMSVDPKVYSIDFLCGLKDEAISAKTTESVTIETLTINS